MGAGGEPGPEGCSESSQADRGLNEQDGPSPRQMPVGSFPCLPPELRSGLWKRMAVSAHRAADCANQIEGGGGLIKGKA